MRKHGSRSALAEAPQSAAPTLPVPASYAVVDFPQDKEVVVSSEYTFRVAASPDADRVEVSIDGGEWRPCRPAVGYWWHDWSGYSKGSYRVTARTTTSSGVVAESEPRRFSVKLPKPEGAAKPAAKAPARGRKKLARLACVEA